MSDNSNFVLRWVIDDAAARLATGRVESQVFNEGGFKWIAAVEKYASVPNDMAHFTLRCDADHNDPWKCEAEVGVSAQHVDRSWYHSIRQDHFDYIEDNDVWLHKSPFHWTSLESDLLYRLNDKVTVEFKINIISSDRGQPIAVPTLFDAPNRRSDVVLVIEEKKLHVSKEFLAVHSPYFETLFFGDFAENGKEEIEIKDVVYEEFLDLLQYVYHGAMHITDRTVPHILKLADQYQMERILDHCKLHLTQSKGFDEVKKLVLADKYRLDCLKDHCLNSFTGVTDLLEKVKLSSEFDNFSHELKGDVCNRIMQLYLKQ